VFKHCDWSEETTDNPPFQEESGRRSADKARLGVRERLAAAMVP
jgi:hypothetical protein